MFENIPSDTILYSNADCEATMDFILAQVPTAPVTYYREVKYVNDQTSGCNATYTYNNLNIYKAFTGDQTVLCYPYAVKLVKADGTSILCENTYTNADTVQNKLVYHRKYNPETICQTDVMSSLQLKRTNYASLPSCITDPFQPGINKLIWYIENAAGEKDSCFTIIEVRDTIAPAIVCGNWEQLKTLYADASCEVAAAQAGLNTPTVTDLQATDNCTASSDINISWKRTFNGENPTTDLSAPFIVGTTIIEWMVSDESGNTTSCYQTIEVIDTTGPNFDCSTLSDLNVDADGNCEATAASVIAAGLVTPEAADDSCSPTGATIPAVGARSDGRSLFTDSYPIGTTTITWTFTDAVGNTTVCTRNVSVTDDVVPVFVDCDNLTDIVISLTAEECSASLDKVKAALGSHTAEDDCSGTIDGVPMLMLPDGSLTALPSAFKKDTTYVIVWVFEDESGNRTECNQNLIIRDVTPPDASSVCPNPTKTVTASVSCTVGYSDLDLPIITLDDPCDGTLIPTVIGQVTQYDGSVTTYLDDELPGAEYPVGVHTFYWIFTDKAGLKDTCKMTLTVEGHQYIIPDTVTVCHNELPYTWRGTDYSVPGVYYDTLQTTAGCDSVYQLTLMTAQYMELIINCDSIKADTIKVDVVPGECSVSADKITLLAPIATNPCSGIQILGVSSRQGGLTMSDPYPTGLTKIIWTFIDTTGTVIHPITTCEQLIQVGDVNKFPIDIANYHDTLIILPENDCEIQFSEMNYNIPPVYDLCTGDHIDSVVTRTSGLLLNTPFTVSTDTIYWDYSFEGQNFRCTQIISVKNGTAPNFICNLLDTIRLNIAIEQDTVHLDSLLVRLPNPLPTATDFCTGQAIIGQYAQRDGSPLPSKIAFTDKLDIYWTFIDATINTVPKICVQSVLMNKSCLIEETAAICDNETYTWHGTDYSVPGIYYDTLQTVAGYDSIYRLTLTVHILPTVTITGEDTLFLTDKTTLTATGGVTYTWSCNDVGAQIVVLTDNDSVVEITPSDTGYFQCNVLVTSENGCVVSTFYNLKVLPCGSQYPLHDVNNNEYATRVYNHTCWMTENLRATDYADGTQIPMAVGYWSEMHPDTAANIAIFGRLYDLASATRSETPLPIQGACPEGWQLPTQDEYMYLNVLYSNSLSLRSTDYWLTFIGTNLSEFDMRPAGLYNATAHRFENLRGNTYFIVADNIYSSSSTFIIVPTCHYSCLEIQLEQNSKNNGLSVRCLKTVR